MIALKSRKFKKISDEMIGMDDRICSCASRVADMILSQEEKAEDRVTLRETADSLKKTRGRGKRKQ